ncbi:MAG TPA: FliH/SctL family protein [Lachnospiraceae bacterium]|nr:FliH/SctL family protein [Lachnospiraceae bacterium]
MSSNLFKRGATYIKNEEVRVIDTNALLAEKISRMTGNRIVPMPPQDDGFAQGLSAEVLNVIPGEGGINTADGEHNRELRVASIESEQEPIDLGPTPEELREQAIAEINQMKEDAALSLEKERQKTLEAAENQGYREGLSQAMQEAVKAKKDLELVRKELEKQYEKQIEDLEPRMVETLTDIYEHIFNVELSGYRDLIVYLISGAMRKTEGGRDIIVHVSKEDYPYVSMQKKQITAGVTALNTNVEMIEDITLSKNQALIETGGGIFDCSLGTQLSELNQKIRLLSYEKIIGE